MTRLRHGIFCCGMAALRQRLPPYSANAQPLPAPPADNREIELEDAP